MYPNPQEALPLPSRPDLEQYKKRAKDLVEACRSGEPDAVRTWATGWKDTAPAADQIVAFARARLAHEGSECALGDAQFAVATSTPPDVAGVQIPLIDLLLRHGASKDLDNSAGNGQSLVHACLANGQPRAAEHLAGRGAPLDLSGAAGLGRLDTVRRLFDGGDKPGVAVTRAEREDALALAAAYGRANTVEFFLDHGMTVDAELTGHGAGQTALHVAAYHGHGDVVRLLLARGASVHTIDKTWHTPPLVWALTGWSRKDAVGDKCDEVVAMLVAAGASVTPDLLEWDKAQADPKMLAALRGTWGPSKAV